VVVLGPRKKALDFGDNMMVGFRTGLVLQLGGCTAILRMAGGCDCVTGRLSNSDNFARSVALAAGAVLKVHTLDIAPLRSESPPQKRSGMARVLGGFHSFACMHTYMFIHIHMFILEPRPYLCRYGLGSRLWPGEGSAAVFSQAPVLPPIQVITPQSFNSTSRQR